MDVIRMASDEPAHGAVRSTRSPTLRQSNCTLPAPHPPPCPHARYGGSSSAPSIALTDAPNRSSSHRYSSLFPHAHHATQNAQRHSRRCALRLGLTRSRGRRRPRTLQALESPAPSSRSPRKSPHPLSPRLRRQSVLLHPSPRSPPQAAVKPSTRPRPRRTRTSSTSAHSLDAHIHTYIHTYTRV